MADRQATFEQFPRIAEVGFGVGAGAGQTLKGLVKNPNDLALFFEGRERDWDCLESLKGQFWLCCSSGVFFNIGQESLRPSYVIQEVFIDLWAKYKFTSILSQACAAELLRHKTGLPDCPSNAHI